MEGEIELDFLLASIQLQKLPEVLVSQNKSVLLVDDMQAVGLSTMRWGSAAACPRSAWSLTYVTAGTSAAGRSQRNHFLL